MIVKSLQEIQERQGFISNVDFAHLARASNVPVYRVQELTSFFPQFRLTPPPELEIHVCQDMTCDLRDARKLIKRIESCQKDGTLDERLEIKRVSCLGRCDRAPVACFRHFRKETGLTESIYTHLDEPGLDALLVPFLSRTEPPPPHLDRTAPLFTQKPWAIDPYDPEVHHPGRESTPEPYAGLRKLLDEDTESEAILGALEAAELLGMGGAGARAHKKWREVWSANSRPKYVVCNGDESEPGTFKDRELLLQKPHLVVEGVLIAGLLLQAEAAIVFVRHEYPEQIEAIRGAIDTALSQLPDPSAIRLEVFASPGGYICGEESALLEVLEDRRAQPRNTPPTVRAHGLFGQPTLLSNVETFAWVPSIVLDEGRHPHGLRFFSVSGDVREPGVYEVSTRLSLGELLYNCAGGLSDQRSLAAVAPSGPSGGILPRQIPTAALRAAVDQNLPKMRKRAPKEADRLERLWSTKFNNKDTVDVLELPLDLAVFRGLGLMLGAGLVFFGARPGEESGSLDRAINCLDFFARESCGKCVPCRLGTQELAGIAKQLRDNGSNPEAVKGLEARFRGVAQAMEQASICGLGRTAARPLSCHFQFFHEELSK